MDRYEIVVESQRLDLDTETEVSSVFALNNLQDISSRQGYYSNEHSFPLTQNNLSIFGIPSNINTYDRKPYRKLKTQILESGQVVVIGVIRVVRTKDRIYCEILGGNADIFTLIKEGKMSDLDIAYMDHDWTLANVLATEGNTWQDGYWYPAIDYGNLLNRDFQFGLVFQELFPAIFFKPLFLQMIARNGYGIGGDFLDDFLFERETLLNPKFTQYEEQFIKDRTSIVTIQGVNNIEAEYDGVLGGSDWKNTLPLNNDNSPNSFHKDISDGKADLFNPLGYYYKSDVFMYANLQIDMIFNVKVTQGKAKIKAYLYKNGVELVTNWEQEFKVGAILNQYTNANQQFSKTITNVLLKPSDRLSLYLEITKNSDLAGFKITLQPEQTKVSFTPAANIPPGGKVNMNSLLPSISQGDFFKNLINQYNLLVHTDTENKIVYVWKFNRLLDRMGEAEDWTDKVDYQQPPEVTYLQENYGQTSILAYKEDEEDKVTPVGYANGQFTIDNEHLPLSAKVYESPFSATIERSVLSGGAVLPYIPVFEVKEGIRVRPYQSDLVFHTTGEFQDFTWWANQLWKTLKDNVVGIVPGESDYFELAKMEDAFEIKEPNIRVLYKDDADLSPVYITDPEQEDISYPYVNNASFLPLAFDNSLLQTHYASLIPSLKDGKFVRALLRLNALDIATLDFTVPKWIGSDHPRYKDMFNAYFYLSAVDGYLHGKGQPTWCDLMKLSPESVTLQEPVKDIAFLTLQSGGKLLLQTKGGILLAQQPTDNS